MAGTNNALNNSATVFQVDNLNLNANTLSSTNALGNIQLTPAAGGNVQSTISAGGSVQAIGSVAGETALLECLQSDNTSASSDAFIRARTGGASGGSGYVGVSNSAGNSFSWGFAAATPTLLKESIGTPGGTLLRQMTSSGEQTLPLQPCFSAIQTSNVTDVTGDGTAYTVIFGTELFDRGSDYDNTTGIFTAPVTGIYHFSAFLLYQQLIAAATPTIQLQTTARNYTVGNFGGVNVTTDGNMPINISLTVPMTAGDTAKIVATVGGMTKVVDIYGNSADARTCFSGILLA